MQHCPHEASEGEVPSVSAFPNNSNGLNDASKRNVFCKCRREQRHGCKHPSAGHCPSASPSKPRQLNVRTCAVQATEERPPAASDVRNTWTQTKKVDEANSRNAQGWVVDRDKMQRVISVLTDEVESMRTANWQLRAQLDSNRTSAESQYADATQQYSQLQTQLHVLIEGTREVEDEVCILQEKCSQLESEKSKQNSQISIMETEKAASDRAIAELRECLTRATTATTTAENSNSALAGRVKTLEVELDRSQHDRAVTIAELRTAQQRISALEGDIRHNQDKMSELRAAQQRISALEEDIRHNQDKLSDLRTAQQRISALEEDIRHNQDKLSDLRTAQQRIDELEGDIRCQQDILSKTKNEATLRDAKRDTKEKLYEKNEVRLLEKLRLVCNKASDALSDTAAASNTFTPPENYPTAAASEIFLKRADHNEDDRTTAEVDEDTTKSLDMFNMAYEQWKHSISIRNTHRAFVAEMETARQQQRERETSEQREICDANWKALVETKEKEVNEFRDKLKKNVEAHDTIRLQHDAAAAYVSRLKAELDCESAQHQQTRNVAEGTIRRHQQQAELNTAELLQAKAENVHLQKQIEYYRRQSTQPATALCGTQDSLKSRGTALVHNAESRYLVVGVDPPFINQTKRLPPQVVDRLLGAAAEEPQLPNQNNNQPVPAQQGQSPIRQTVDDGTPSKTSNTAQCYNATGVTEDHHGLLDKLGVFDFSSMLDDLGAV
eukprot:GHVQ01024052.1.p2 GENE.GHVQ01024052.1~~GHVQ01024052.1.p2  ORF type:complete len:727 (-),score=124.39 GHVQ01024052.1:3953-6133(-)